MRPATILSAALTAWAASASMEAGAASGSGQVARPPAGATSAPPAGLTIINRSCTSCHDSAQIMRARPAADWPPIIDRMRANGAVISDADAQTVQDYLIRNYSAHR